MYYQIDQERCTQCGVCLNECFLDLTNQSRVNPTVQDCSGCGHCFMACPNDAIEPTFKTVHTDQPKQAIPYEKLAGFFKARRSYRQFKHKTVENEMLKSLIDDARFVPSGGNSHAYEFTIIKDKRVLEQLKTRIMRLYKFRGSILKSSVLKALIGPFTDKQTRSLLKGKAYYDRIQFMLKQFNDGVDTAFYEAPVVILIHASTVFPTPKEDAVLVGYNINLLAESMGLGACFVTLVQYAVNTSMACKKLVGLSKNDNVHTALVLGYPIKNYLKTPVRQTKKITII